MNDYIRFSKQSDAQSSLDEFCFCVERTFENEYFWKYAIISIHNALQGYLCISLRNGNNFQTWNERHLKKWIEAYENNRKLPNTKLDYFMELFDKAFADRHDLIREDIEWLNDTRNNFIHFNNDSLSVHRISVVRCCNEALTSIKLTPAIAGGIFFYEEEQEKSFKIACHKAFELLELAKNKT